MIVLGCEPPCPNSQTYLKGASEFYQLKGQNVGSQLYCSKAPASLLPYLQWKFTISHCLLRKALRMKRRGDGSHLFQPRWLVKETAMGRTPEASAILWGKETGEISRTGLPGEVGKEVSRLPSVGWKGSEDFLIFILKFSITPAAWRLGDTCSQAASKSPRSGHTPKPVSWWTRSHLLPKVLRVSRPRGGGVGFTAKEKVCTHPPHGRAEGTLSLEVPCGLSPPGHKAKPRATMDRHFKTASWLPNLGGRVGGLE